MPTSLRTECPQCGKTLRVSAEQAGQRVRCPACRQVFAVSSVGFSGGQSIAPSQDAAPTQGEVAFDTGSTVNCPAALNTLPLRNVGRFLLHEELGQGGFGQVYRAYDPVLERDVAIKLPRFTSSNQAQLRRFVMEAKAAACLKHPHIVGVYESGEVDGQPYIASELVTGETLAQRLKRVRPSLREAATWVRALAEALAYAHGEGIVHRDIKPENIMLSADGRPQIMDFGLAKRMDDNSSLTIEGSVLGTPAYMSPEQARGELDQVGPASDQYSLGTTLYELLTGQRPFDGPPHTVIAAVTSSEPPRPQSLNPDIPRDLEAICLRTISKEPKQRYTALSALAADLTNWLEDRPVLARPATWSEQLFQWCRRQPVIAGLSASVAVALLLGIAVSSVFAFRAIAQAKRAITAEERAKLKAAEADANRQFAEAKTAEAISHTYVTDMNLAQMNWDASRIGVVHQFLNRWRPKPGEKDLRGWEWHYQSQLCSSDLRSYPSLATLSLVPQAAFLGYVRCVSFSPDGARIASTSGSEIRIWETTTGNMLKALKSGSGGSVSSIGYHPHGTHIVAGDDSGAITAWSLASGRVTSSIKAHHLESGVLCSVSSVAFSPTGMLLASAGSEGIIKLWDASTGRELHSFRAHANACESVAFSPDGSRLASVGVHHQLPERAYHALKLWNSETGEQISTIPVHTDDIKCVSFSPDGLAVATASRDRLVKLWDIAAGRELRSLAGHSNHVNAVAYSPTGKLVASGSADSSIRIWEAATGREVRIFRGHREAINALAFSPDGSVLASASNDGFVKLWGVYTTSDQRKMKGHESYSYVISAISPDGSLMASASNAGTFLTDLHSGLQKKISDPEDRTAPNSISCMAFDRTSGRLATGTNGTLRIRTVSTNATLVNFKAHSRWVREILFSPDGKYVATWGGNSESNEDTETRMWNAATGKMLWNDSGLALGIAFHPHGTNLTVVRPGSLTRPNSEIRILDVATGKVVRTLPERAPLRVAYSPDGTVLALGGDDGKVALIDPLTGKDVLSFTGHTRAITRLAFHPDGTRLVTGSFDESAKLWDTATGQELRTFTGYAGPVNGIAFTADGKRLISTSEGATLIVADAGELPPDARIELEVRNVLAALRENDCPRMDAVDRIAKNGTISELVRQKAIALINDYLE
ncbi:MAG: protein kinase [Planctomycetaceae bacterium]